MAAPQGEIRIQRQPACARVTVAAAFLVAVHAGGSTASRCAAWTRLTGGLPQASLAATRAADIAEVIYSHVFLHEGIASHDKNKKIQKQNPTACFTSKNLAKLWCLARMTVIVNEPGPEDWATLQRVRADRLVVCHMTMVEDLIRCVGHGVHYHTVSGPHGYSGGESVADDRRSAPVWVSP